MYPLKMDPIYYVKIWGGQEFAKFRSNVPEGRIGESWDIACHPNGTSVVSNGRFAGMNLNQIIEMNPMSLLGSAVIKKNRNSVSDRAFPLLFKLIDASEALSVQVHPDDRYNLSASNEPGKTECWYVLEADEGSELIMGTIEIIEKSNFKDYALNGTLEPWLRKIKAKKGDFYHVPSGMIHAIGSGIVIAEIQQNSDTTFRVYDYGRQRELHLDKAAEVIDFSLEPIPVKAEKIKYDDYSETILTECDYFRVSEIEIDSAYIISSSGDRFKVLTCVDGSGMIKHSIWEGVFNKGDSILLPADSGITTITGRLKMLLTEPYPDLS